MIVLYIWGEFMPNFNLKYDIKKEKIKTEYGLVIVENIMFDYNAFEDYLIKIIFEKETLEYIFKTEIKCQTDYEKMLLRFTPRKKDLNVEQYVIEKCNGANKNNGFYSFFAEALLPLVYKDIKGYNLTTAAIDINHTLFDTETGADTCLYDENNKVLVLGEAKFYKSFSQGLAAVGNSLSNSNFYNKLNNFMNKNLNFSKYNFILRELNKNQILEITVEDFATLKLSFAGFVLHEGTKRENYSSYTYNYNTDKCNANSIETIAEKMCNIENVNYELSLFHFPINNKEKLIEAIINKALELLGELK